MAIFGNYSGFVFEKKFKKKGICDRILFFQSQNDGNSPLNNHWVILSYFLIINFIGFHTCEKTNYKFYINDP